MFMMLFGDLKGGGGGRHGWNSEIEFERWCME